ncbi:MAG: uncharacterized protein QOK29_4075 [Rhodospirillaceae bacterium]|jgi:hypothetical protein|nr:uncharacterized protein [Rhodospirillaceae bacterium]
MADTWLRYDRMVEQALRGVVRKAIEEAMHRGLPGEHHFYITFHTDRPGVGIADWLHQQYPQEMTIILQHQFWDLTVDDDRFAVTLSFGGRHEHLTVPFSAITAFADPSVKFGLQFEASAEELQAMEPSTTAPKEADQRIAAGKPAGDDPHKGADVVTLDAFRKK